MSTRVTRHVRYQLPAMAVPDIASAALPNASWRAYAAHSRVLSGHVRYLIPAVSGGDNYREIHEHGLLKRQFADAVEARGDAEEVA